MTSSPTIARAAEDYLEAVREHLADLPPVERDGLLADVEPALLEAGESPEQLRSRLGTPERFAEELRLAAGLSARPMGGASAPWLEVRLARLRRFAEPVESLLPLWWALRAYVAVCAVAIALGSTWPAHPTSLVPMLHSGRDTMLIFAAALVASVLLGIWRRPWMVGFDLLLVLCLIPVGIHFVRAQHSLYQPAPATFVAPEPQGITFNGGAVQNIYPYDARGHLLHNVRLYDQAGRPLNLGTARIAADPWRQRVRRPGGRQVLNAYPIRYYAPGTHRVTHPDAAPPVHAGRLAGAGRR